MRRLALPVRRLRGQLGAGGVDDLALGLEHLRSPAAAPATRSRGRAPRARSAPGDGEVAQHVAQPDRRADPQRAPLALAGEQPGVVRAGGAGVCMSTNSLISVLTTTGCRPCGRCPAPSRTTSRPPVSSAKRRPRSSGWQRSSVPCSTSTGQVSACDSATASSSVAGRSGAWVRAARVSASVCSAHPTRSSKTLDECGSGSSTARVVVDPARDSRRATAVVDRLERLRVRARAGARRRAIATIPRTRSGCAVASSSDHLMPEHSATRNAASRAGRVEHGERVGGVHLVGVRGRTGRPVRAAVAARVDGDHPEVPGQVGHLALPLPAVDDRERPHHQQVVGPEPNTS